MNIEYKIPDLRESKKLYELCKEFINARECYTNVALTFLGYIKHNPEYKDYKIVFGAWEIKLQGKESNLFAKHCYFIHNGKVIDPTIFATTNEYLSRRYINIVEFNQKKYFEELHKNNFDTNLGGDMIKLLNIKTMELYQKGIVVIG